MGIAWLVATTAGSNQIIKPCTVVWLQSESQRPSQNTNFAFSSLDEHFVLLEQLL